MAVVAEKPRQQVKKGNTVPLDWNEVYYTNCPLVSASNVDQETWLDEGGVQEDPASGTRSCAPGARTTGTRITSTTSTT